MKLPSVALSRAVAGLFLLFIAALLAAQDNLPKIGGVVRSRRGDPVADAMIAAKTPSGNSRSATSGPDGGYSIEGIAPGTYTLEVSRNGFSSEGRAGVSIAAGQSLTIDFALQPASGPTGERINENQLAGLPLNGRSYSQLATLEAGVTDTSNAQASRGVGGGSLTISGGRGSSNNFQLDGTNIMDVANQAPRSAAGVQLGSDSVFQVQVFAVQYGAENGRGSGGVLNSITRSGGNEFHGTLFEYLRNSKLDARNVIDPDPEPPPFKRNQFGFTVSGPVAKERTYFSGSYEAMRDRLTETDLNFYPDAQARRGIITDERGNEVRRIEGGIDPRVEPYLALYPIPNLGSAGGGLGLNAGAVFMPTNETFWSVRVDHKLTQRDSLFVRYTFDDATSYDKQNTYLFRTVNKTRQQYVTLVGTHIFNLRLLTAFRFGYTRPVSAIRSVSSLTIPESLYFVAGAPQLGTIDIPGVPNFGPAFTTPEHNTYNTIQFADDVVWQRGAHALRFGFDLHRYRADIFNGFNKSGAWTFNSLDSFLGMNKSGTGVIAALPGSDNRKAFRQTFFGIYIQDNYRLTSALQVNLGMRYEGASIIQEKYNRIAFVPDTRHDTGVQIGQMLPGNPSPWNFEPRVALSWAPPKSRDTVVAAGAGIYTDPLLEYVVDLQKNSAPFHKVAVIPNLDATGVFPDAIGAALRNSLGSRFQLQILDYNHMKTSRVLRYNLSLQHALPGGVRGQLAYVGSRGNHLFRGYEDNLYPQSITRTDGTLFFPANAGPLNPAFGSIAFVGTDAQSFYNALQFTASRNFGRGASLQGNYSYTKSVDDTSNASSGTSAAAAKQYPLMRTTDRALSDFDVRHRLSINYFYTFPATSRQRWLNSPVLAQVLGGWRVGGIVSYRSGTPFHARVNIRPSGFLFVANRPNLLPGKSNNPVEGVTAGCEGVAAAQKLGGSSRYFDPCSFGPPEPGTLGNAGRNTIFGPSVFSTDLSLQKDIVLGGERRLQFRAEFFNVPNHSNFAKPSAGASIVFSGAAARPNATAGRLTQSATTSRQIQFALRFSF